MASASLQALSPSELVPFPIPGFDGIRSPPGPKWVWVVGSALAGLMVAASGEWLRDLMLLIRRRGSAPALSSRTSGKYVVLLRSFGDDGTKVVARRTGPEVMNVLAACTPRRRRYLEEVIGWSLRSIGPIVAVADPRLPVAAGSATSEQVVLGDEWKSVVQQLLADAHVVAAVVGRTPGVQWELQQIASTDAIRRTVFVIPPGHPNDTSQRLATLCRALRVDAPADDDGPPPLAAVVVDGRLTLVRTGADEEIDFRAAIERSLQLLGRSPTPG